MKVTGTIPVYISMNKLACLVFRCRKLPKSLKEWQAYGDLRRTIDDFNEVCPLLELMTNKSMQSRHWDRIGDITRYQMDVESPSFMLRNLLEAPLLKYKEDFEVNNPS